MSRPICPLINMAEIMENATVETNHKTAELKALQAELEALQMRLKLARKAAGYTQASMAKELGVKLDAYKKYENRKGSDDHRGSFMPLLTFRKFCEITGQEPYYLLSGKYFPRHPVHLRSVK
jgi:DNA-binding XRE family transcriptional regulator